MLPPRRRTACLCERPVGDAAGEGDVGGGKGRGRDALAPAARGWRSSAGPSRRRPGRPGGTPSLAGDEVVTHPARKPTCRTSATPSAIEHGTFPDLETRRHPVLHRCRRTLAGSESQTTGRPRRMRRGTRRAVTASGARGRPGARDGRPREARCFPVWKPRKIFPKVQEGDRLVDSGRERQAPRAASSRTASCPGAACRGRSVQKPGFLHVIQRHPRRGGLHRGYHRSPPDADGTSGITVSHYCGRTHAGWSGPVRRRARARVRSPGSGPHPGPACRARASVGYGVMTRMLVTRRGWIHWCELCSLHRQESSGVRGMRAGRADLRRGPHDALAGGRPGSSSCTAISAMGRRGEPPWSRTPT